MKKVLSLLLAVILTVLLTACGTPQNNSAQDPTEPTAPQDAYVLSEKVKEGSVIDGLMTDISGKDAILRRSTASWADTCVMYEVNIRQFTEEGTFAAFEEHLDRLRDMGINTLWLMPIHPISETGRKGTLGSYYAVSDYRGVNPEFGTKEDFLHLVDTAHEMGFKVMLDWVANHTGWDHPWITEHPDWYVRRSNGEIESPYDWTDTAKLDYDNYEMRAQMIRCMLYWVEEMGVDGFRCDHATGVPAPFWNAAVYKLKSVNSEILMLAESNTSGSLTSYAFDSCYNDSLYGQIASVGGGVHLDGIRSAMDVKTYYSEGSFPMNYLDNHDKNSSESTVPERCGEAYPALLALTFTAPGYPMIYTSDEQGYDHMIAFFEKDPVVWDDEPQYAPLIAGLSGLKSGNPALASSNQDITFYDADSPNLIAYSRAGGGSTLVYLANLSGGELSASVPVDFETATCVLHGDGATLETVPKQMTKSDLEHMTCKPYEFFILIVD